jgi:hypothetical protein
MRMGVLLRSWTGGPGGSATLGSKNKATGARPASRAEPTATRLLSARYPGNPAGGRRLDRRGLA